VEQHSTFLAQSLFFALVLVENLSLAAFPLVYAEPATDTNRAVACLGRSAVVGYALRVAALCIASWCCHAAYYKCAGHPWSDINGPELSRGRLKFSFHFCGRERLLDCGLKDQCEDGDEEEEKKPRCSRISCLVTSGDSAQCFPARPEDVGLVSRPQSV